MISEFENRNRLLHFTKTCRIFKPADLFKLTEKKVNVFYFNIIPKITQGNNQKTNLQATSFKEDKVIFSLTLF
jgi:hypothetical protein